MEEWANLNWKRIKYWSILGGKLKQIDLQTYSEFRERKREGPAGVAAMSWGSIQRDRIDPSSLSLASMAVVVYKQLDGSCDPFGGFL
ncbi:hypothetical protein [Oryza sativa Japonica Group]|uniref:Uncharacterized protein n=1 Tax=Oryza sativa subsp. japonica TaxID=39947 RepID=Q5ZBM0_ORYSJ|nr:hypothetical protein [Oryza sativa Japonica Group]BAD61479.1 hypothetical protein [Oryza sativa Japonica Group]